MNHSEDISKIIPAYVKAQSMIGKAEKDGHNTHLGSRYSTLDAVWSVAKPALAANGLAVIQTPTIDGQVVVCVSRLLHTSGQWMEQSMSLPWTPGRNALQAAGGAMTYAKRYSLLALLGIGGDAVDDDDGHVDRLPHADEMPTEQRAASVVFPPPATESGDWHKRFFAELKRILPDVTGREVSDWHKAAHGKGLSDIDNETRSGLLAYLAAEDGRHELLTWLGKRMDEQQAKDQRSS